ncbi:hypothetical protein BC830DRAFT_775678 [Chytriomyces sp. MP71]|nr:hypothetical protein BC830DRAFT_775678 [Chytriomyces sp. MP71]
MTDTHIPPAAFDAATALTSGFLVPGSQVRWQRLTATDTRYERQTAVTLLRSLCCWKPALASPTSASSSWCAPTPARDACFHAHLALRNRAIPGLLSAIVLATRKSPSQLYIFDVRDPHVAANAAEELGLQGLRTLSNGSFSVDSIQSIAASPMSLDANDGNNVKLEYQLFVASIMNSLERRFSPLGIVRLKEEFLLTPSFFGEFEDCARLYHSPIRRPMISIVPKLSIVGSTIFMQFKLA